MEKQKRYNTSLLYSTSSFLSGAGTVLNLSGNFYEFNTFDTGIEADEKAIANDFRMIGQDLFDVFDSINGENNKSFI